MFEPLRQNCRLKSTLTIIINLHSKEKFKRKEIVAEFKIMASHTVRDERQFPTAFTKKAICLTIATALFIVLAAQTDKERNLIRMVHTSQVSLDNNSGERDDVVRTLESIWVSLANVSAESFDQKY